MHLNSKLATIHAGRGVDVLKILFSIYIIFPHVFVSFGFNIWSSCYILLYWFCLSYFGSGIVSPSFQFVVESLTILFGSLNA